MKYVLTDNKNVIVHISDTIGYQENGNPLVDNGALAIGCPVTVNEVESVPEEVEVHKYCYTVEKGFYANQDYVEFIPEEDKIAKLEKELADTQIAITELYERLES